MARDKTCIWEEERLFNSRGVYKHTSCASPPLIVKTQFFSHTHYPSTEIKKIKYKKAPPPIELTLLAYTSVRYLTLPGWRCTPCPRPFSTSRRVNVVMTPVLLGSADSAASGRTGGSFGGFIDCSLISRILVAVLVLFGLGCFVSATEVRRPLWGWRMKAHVERGLAPVRLIFPLKSFCRSYFLYKIKLLIANAALIPEVKSQKTNGSGVFFYRQRAKTILKN